jgi:hypothetical protein
MRARGTANPFYPVKKLIIFSTLSALVISAQAGDYERAPLGKSPVGKSPIEECIDLGGSISVGYETHYLYKGYLFGQDAATAGVNYTVPGLALPVTFSANYVNVVSGNFLSNATNDDLSFGVRIGLPTFAGIESSLSYVYHMYLEDPLTRLYPSSQGEVGLHLSRDIQIALLKFDLFYNNSGPNSWNGMIPGGANNDTGAWYWDLGMEREIDILGQGLVLAGGVTYADNYWGRGPNFRTGGRSSGWNHYYLRASLPIALNCRTTFTPYVGFVGSPDTWLMDGMPNWLGLAGQSDILHGGVNLNVAF